MVPCYIIMESSKASGKSYEKSFWSLDTRCSQFTCFNLSSYSLYRPIDKAGVDAMYIVLNRIGWFLQVTINKYTLTSEYSVGNSTVSLIKTSSKKVHT